MIEFALVLPIFLLLVMGILDFGFLFYNYISLENSARNAARIACVSYADVPAEFYAEGDAQTGRKPSVILELPATDADLTTSYPSAYSRTEKKICVEVAKSLRNTGISTSDGVTVEVEFTYDNSGAESSNETNWQIQDRYDGDVVITVRGKAHVLTPVLGVTADHMKKQLTSSSTFKVERQYEMSTTVAP